MSTRQKKIIVFGGSGFLGSHVADVLSDKGYKVIIYDILPYKRLKKDQQMVIGDICDEKKVKKVMENVYAVYNFSAIADIEEALLDPLKAAKVNVLGNLNLMNIAKDCDVKRYIFASSIYVYGTTGSFYRASKHAAELFIESFHEVHKLDYTILRYGSLYGRYADDNNWIYRILKDALTVGEIKRYGDGEEIREYIHVEDAARYSVDVLSDDYRNECLIITGHHPIKIKDFLKMIEEIMGNKIKIKYLPSRETYHYEITPYSFIPKMARKFTSNYYIDLGQGILDCLNHIHEDMSKKQPDCKKGKSAC